MLKYMPLKEDATSHTPDDESLKVNSLSRSSSDSLADAQGKSQRSPRDSPMFNSAPSSLNSRSSASSNITLLTPSSDDCQESPLVSSGSASSLSTSSSVPLLTARTLSLPLPSSPTSLESAIIGLAKTAIAPSKILADPLEKLVEQRNELMSKLIKTVGNRRANNLFVNHAQQWHYLLVYAEEDAALGTKLRRILEGYKYVTVAGPWEVQLGDQRLDVWQKLLESSTMVLVLLSRALLRDKVLGICFPGTLIRRNSVVPLFVEPLLEEEITPVLKPIIHRSGEKIYRHNWNAKSCIQALHKSYRHDVHYGREVFLLEQLLEEIKSDVNYVCRCRKC
ncbi:uncharacterized protein LOC125042649 [Penaeus chinensis]|uniref:uncharacterized protein LOC125042649 n=1 Tax=Penaeus chinensis TaxID=139456 RepID=UPI001FB68E29|nr:uncharacterized protein LOC125042649 [Penaeus chinensis]XP_047494397.1 uncharacterized protein LOC125042649 [Penaeus chinensis]XP_047494406.1 uncharacterized protein LOC125042649 [Penaeus chinensis]XP_047494413.1 uncharacterized protein LOC125042649 [Penaeus chinensis]XP_047494421.1 uncharacterized protein LOC125042649 [Penaeus chinensis]XP_047494431.1 uncharacterized protein LOC125042649 [Penaeus chinensis]XP_047494439.1 uncharacterized protein LOC125042649 [Penaeus chinensis]